ncbi:MAG: TolC family protein [Acidobacteria bacterium Pan2503]|uniref:TolC family protein n=1 Tax=Candidatus Acidiferrum panamense TaxID=2741543 RepID=A0A7V8SXV6_9BACT|nr:TolC family protein [Candidatus Acidoferrum panamensis]
MRSLGIFAVSWPIAAALCLCGAGMSVAQETPSPATAATKKNPAQTTAAGAPGLKLTLQDALERARKNSVSLQAALTDSAIAHQDRFQAGAALLPTVTYNNQAWYTQGHNNAPLFIANNAVHEYLSQGNIHESLDLASVESFRRASALAAAAKARAEIASRGLVVTVVEDYYAVAAAQQKLLSAQKTADEGDRFFKLTQDLEHGGEVAHSDVIKAELQAQERRRALQEAQLALLNARLDLAVLIFPDFNENFELSDDLHAPSPLPTLGEVQQQAAQNNPDIRAALETVRAAGFDLTGARAGYLPSLSFDYWYGIDAPQFAVNGPNGVSNLGSSVLGTLTIPIWNWGATQSRVKQAELRRAQSQRELSLAERRLLAEIKSLYSEAETAMNELGGLSRSAELAEESLRLTTLRYKGGEATVLEVVDAQTTYAQSNAAYQDGAVRYRVALANLQTLTGVLTTP